MRDIGKNIRDLRARAGLSQDQLAERLFVTRQTVSNYETGRTRPDVDQILRIAEVFGTDANAVLYGPPEREDRRRDYVRAGIGLALTAALWGCYHLLVVQARAIQTAYYDPMYTALLGCVVRPLLLLLTGWTLMQFLLLFVAVKLPQKLWVRRTWWALAAVALMAVLMPAAIWALVRFAGSLSGPVVAKYWRLLYTLLLLNAKNPYLCPLLGAALRLLRQPNDWRRKDEEAAPTV